MDKLVFNAVQTLKCVHKYQEFFILVIFDAFQTMITVIQRSVTKTGLFQGRVCQVRTGPGRAGQGRAELLPGRAGLGRAFEKVGPEHLCKK